jgi:hypothetical protein
MKLIYKIFTLLLSLTIINLSSASVSAHELSNDISSYEIEIEPLYSPDDNMLDGGGLSSINLSSFRNKYGVYADSFRPGTYYYNGMTLIRDRGVNSGNGTHGGSYWKLFNRNGTRIGTYDMYGNYLRP